MRNRLKLNINNSLWLTGFLLVICAWICGLFIDLTGDSGLYAAISRQMVESGDWLTLRINGEPYYHKPHLFFWLGGTGIRMFGNSNFAFKLFPFLFGLLSLYFIYRFAKFIYSEKAGRLAAIIAGTSQMFFLYFLDIHIDTVLQTGVILALWQLAVHLRNGKGYSLFFGFLGIGLAMLSKGPVGAVIPLFFVVFNLLLNKKIKELFHPKWLTGIVLVVIIILPALLHLWRNFGREGIFFYFIHNNIGRITGEVAGSDHDPLYYIYNMLWALLPWTVPVIAGLYIEMKSWVNRSGISNMSASLLGSTLILLFVFSIAKGQAPNYFMVMIPPIAVVASGRIIQAFKKSKPGSGILITVFEISLLIVLIFLLIAVFILSSGLFYPLLLTVISITVIYFCVFKGIHSFERLAFVSVLMTGIFNLFFNAGIIPALYSYQGTRQVLNIFEANRQEGDRLCNFETEEYELFFYAGDPVLNINDWDELYSVMERPGTWLYTNETKYKDIKNMNYQNIAVYEIRQRGMNRITLPFLNPQTRDETLKSNYLIRTR
ncbi:MAG: glycosyltransferase family 39 protein [Prolixibacteraceae bacterium]|nr:glycosyltransferase family 39 protein [Prolixibacteraceae bacterium]